MEPIRLTIPESLEGMRLDKAIAELESSLSRNQIKGFIEEDLVHLNGLTTKASAKVMHGDTIVIERKEPEVLDLEPVNLNLDIIYQDKDLLVVNKPSGMIVHPAETVKEPTLVHGLLAEVDDLGVTNDTIRPGIVHRIDKETSGLLVVAKHEQALKALQASLKAQKVKREYYALVEGVIPHNIGKIDAPIGRDKKDRKRMSVQSGGRASVTHFQVVERFEAHTLILCQLETGRTHQIRVHLRYIGHPIVGDPVYGRRKTDTEFGQYLHAATLAFDHPATNELMTFEAKLPDFFETKLSHLRG